MSTPTPPVASSIFDSTLSPLLTMTDHEALQETRRRWGNDAAVHHHERAWYPFEVGQWISTGFRVWGQGDSWEEAFANADCQGRS